MKKIILSLIAVSFFSNVSFAECNFATGITKNDNGTFTYVRDCHIKVGEIKQDLEISQNQNDKILKALDLKDLALTKSDQRADLWKDTTFKLEDRLNTIDKMRTTDSWLYFGLGAVSMFAATYAASQMLRH